MHAIVVEEFGDSSKLLYREVADPVVGPGTVAVRQKLTSVNFADIASRRGIGSKVPFTPGLDGMGTVAAVGAGVTRVKVGDRVAVWADGGSYCDIVVAREELVYPVAASVPDEVAASPTVLVTAYNVLHLASKLQAGETVLIHAAAGGVGSVLVQMAKEIGAGKIFATAGGPEKLAVARGADRAPDRALKKSGSLRLRRLGQGLRQFRRHGGHFHEQLARDIAREQTVLALIDLAHGVVVDQDGKHDVAFGSDIRRARGPNRAAFDQRLRLVGAAVPDHGLLPLVQHPRHHRGTHAAEAAKSNIHVSLPCAGFA